MSTFGDAEAHRALGAPRSVVEARTSLDVALSRLHDALERSLVDTGPPPTTAPVPTPVPSASSTPPTEPAGAASAPVVRSTNEVSMEAESVEPVAVESAPMHEPVAEQESAAVDEFMPLDEPAPAEPAEVRPIRQPDSHEPRVPGRRSTYVPVTEPIDIVPRQPETRTHRVRNLSRFKK